jgi:putative flippase GtrA
VSPKKSSYSLHTWWSRSPEFGRYLFFGGLKKVLTYIIYLAGLRLMNYRPAYTVSFILGILLSYLFNAQFVFKKKLRVAKALQFFVVYLAQYFVGLGLLFILVEIARVSKVLAPILLLFLIVPTNYGLNRCVFKGKQASSRLP